MTVVFKFTQSGLRTDSFRKFLLREARLFPRFNKSFNIHRLAPSIVDKTLVFFVSRPQLLGQLVTDAAFFLEKSPFAMALSVQ